jgi:phage terminase large subunit
VLIIIDEAPGVDPKIIEAIEGIRAGGDVRILKLGNPTISSGAFYDEFHSKRASIQPFTISAFDTPNFEGIKLSYEAQDSEGAPITVTLGDPNGRDLMDLSEEELDQNVMPWLTTRRWVKERFEEWGPGDFRWDSRVMGDFPSQSPDALLSLAWLERAQRDTRTYDGKVDIGIDVAGPGEDETVMCARCGFQILEIIGWGNPDPRGELVSALRKYGDRIGTLNVDSAGIGYYLHKHLQDLGFPSNAVNVGESPADKEQFVNLKAELYWGLRMRAKSGDLAGLDDETSISQLASIRWKPNSRGQTEIESKEAMRKRGVRSPDRAEAIMLAFAKVAKNGAGLLEYYQGITATQTGGDQDPNPKTPGFRPAPTVTAPVKAPALTAYNRAMAALAPQDLCDHCGKPLGDTVVEEGIRRMHPDCARPSWAS